jgi:hypothetical protein
VGPDSNLECQTIMAPVISGVRHIRAIAFALLMAALTYLPQILMLNVIWALRHFWQAKTPHFLSLCLTLPWYNVQKSWLRSIWHLKLLEPELSDYPDYSLGPQQFLNYHKFSVFMYRYQQLMELQTPTYKIF